MPENLIDAQLRVCQLFDACLTFMDFDPKQNELNVIGFRPDKETGRDHPEFFIQSATKNDSDLPYLEYRTYVVNMYSDRDEIICRTMIVKHSDTFSEQFSTLSKKMGKKAFKQMAIENTERTETEYVVLTRHIQAELTLAEHVLVEAKRRKIYFGWGDVP